MFLVRLVPPLHSNEISRITESSKVHFLDSGLMAALRGLTAARIKADRSLLGAPLELFHFRDHYGTEVDLVVEDSDGNIVGIEVKASATVTVQDFNALRKLQHAAGKRFVAGFVLQDSDTSVPFGNAMTALPVSAPSSTQKWSKLCAGPQ